MIQDVHFRYVVLFGAVTAVANIVSETVLGFLNTTNFMDAVFGVVGTAISFVYLSMIYKKGLILLEEKKLTKHGRK